MFPLRLAWLALLKYASLSVIFGALLRSYLWGIMMSGQTQGHDDEWQRWRDFLCLMARVQLAPWLQRELDVSGVVQQTLLEAYQGIERFRGLIEEEKARWMRRALTNNLADEMRRLGAAKRGAGRESSLEELLGESSSRLNAWLAADQSSPSERAIRQEQLLQLAGTLARLPEEQRTAVELRYFHGCTLSEVADHLGKSKGAAAMLLLRAVRSLREQLADPQPG
jgi:RNA polymerase sigma-70 factor (ECF subfamily)